MICLRRFALLTVVCSLAAAQAAYSDDAPVRYYPAPGSTGPGALFVAGALGLTGSVLPSLAFGATAPPPGLNPTLLASGHYYAYSTTNPNDRWLLLPLAGPWVDFAKTSHPSPLLVADGIGQSASAAAIVAAFIWKSYADRAKVEDTTDAKKADAPRVTAIAPTVGDAGTGLSVIGTF